MSGIDGEPGGMDTFAGVVAGTRLPVSLFAASAPAG
jgi:hypothetical protein